MRIRRWTKIVIFVVALILVIVAIYSGLQILESTVLYKEPELEPTVPSKTITRNGVDYFPRQDITTFLIMGIDESGPVKDSKSYNNEGEADVVLLAVLDEKSESYSIMMLNRDTMMDIPILGLGGKPAGTKYGQLAISHTYGSGLEDSCENTKEAVSRFLGNIYIDYYIAINMDAIAILNDAVGGVRVTVTDDFKEIDPNIKIGEMILEGDQALTFIQTRKGLSDQMNTSRMNRHQEYMNGFVTAMKYKTDASSSFLMETYESIAPYVVSDCPVSTLSDMISKFSDFKMEGVVTPEGENHRGTEFMEFYVDHEKLDELVLQLFYAVK